MDPKVAGDQVGDEASTRVGGVRRDLPSKPAFDRPRSTSTSGRSTQPRCPAHEFAPLMGKFAQGSILLISNRAR